AMTKGEAYSSQPQPRHASHLTRRKWVIAPSQEFAAAPAVDEVSRARRAADRLSSPRTGTDTLNCRDLSNCRHAGQSQTAAGYRVTAVRRPLISLQFRPARAGAG